MMSIINLDWNRIPKMTRERFLGNVFCANCKGAVRITDYTIENSKMGLLIKGKCSKCGGDVARVVEV